MNIERGVTHYLLNLRDDLADTIRDVGGVAPEDLAEVLLISGWVTGRPEEDEE